MNTELIISGIPVKIIEYKDQRVITTREIAQFHNLEVYVINQKFRRNKKHFKENIDYFVISKEHTKCDVDLSYLFTSGNISEIYLFTISGYLNFIKTINDNKAWEIYQQLKDSYFKVQRLNKIEMHFLEKSKEHRKGLTGEWKEHDAKDYRGLTIAEYEALFQDETKRKANMDDKELSLLSAFEFLENRKLENNPQLKGDSELAGSLKDTGQKINGIIKKPLVTK